MPFLPTLGESKSHRSWECLDSWGLKRQLRVEKRTAEGLKKNNSWAHKIAFNAEDLQPFRIIFVEDDRDKLRKLLAVAKTESSIMTSWELLHSVLAEEQSEAHGLHKCKSDRNWKILYKSLQAANLARSTQASFPRDASSSPQLLSSPGPTRAGQAPSDCDTDREESMGVLLEEREPSGGGSPGQYAEQQPPASLSAVESSAPPPAGLSSPTPERPSNLEASPVVESSAPPPSNHLGAYSAMDIECDRKVFKPKATSFNNTVSWDLLAEPGATEILNKGNTLFKFMCRTVKNFTDEDRAMLQPLVDTTGYKDELAENGVPPIDFSDKENLGLHTVIVVRNHYMLPGLKLENITPGFLTSDEYHLRCQPGPPKVEPYDPAVPDTCRCTKTIIKFVFNVTIMLKCHELKGPEIAQKLAYIDGITPAKVMVYERTKRNRTATDGTITCKTFLLYYPVTGGILCTHLTVVVNKTVPRVVAPVVNSFGGQGAGEAAETAELTRAYLIEKFGDSRIEMQQAQPSPTSRRSTLEQKQSPAIIKEGKKEEVEKKQQETAATTITTTTTTTTTKTKNKSKKESKTNSPTPILLQFILAMTFGGQIAWLGVQAIYTGMTKAFFEEGTLRSLDAFYQAENTMTRDWLENVQFAVRAAIVGFSLFGGGLGLLLMTFLVFGGALLYFWLSAPDGNGAIFLNAKFGSRPDIVLFFLLGTGLGFFFIDMLDQTPLGGFEILDDSGFFMTAVSVILSVLGLCWKTGTQQQTRKDKQIAKEKEGVLKRGLRNTNIGTVEIDGGPVQDVSALDAFNALTSTPQGREKIWREQTEVPMMKFARTFTGFTFGLVLRAALHLISITVLPFLRSIFFGEAAFLTNYLWHGFRAATEL